MKLETAYISSKEKEQILDLRRRKSHREDCVEQRCDFQCSDEASFKINHRSLGLGNQKGCGTNDLVYTCKALLAESRSKKSEKV